MAFGRLDAALLQYSQVSTLPKADESNVSVLRNLVRHIDSGLRGPGASTWGSPTEGTAAPLPFLGWQILRMLLLIFWTPRSQETGLVVLADIDSATRSAFEFSTIYRRLQRQILYPLQEGYLEPLWLFLHKAWKFIAVPLRWLLYFRHIDFTEDAEKSGGPSATTTAVTVASAHVLTRISDDSSIGHRIATIRSAVTTLAACLLPTAAIAILSSLHQTATLIAVLGALTLLFAIGLMFFTSKTPTRIEIFGATAA
jgi:hypothetical protein